jgi:hypothetical protein
MGAALIVPVLAIIVAIAIAVIFYAGKTSRAQKAEETLPDEPYARREEELTRLRAEHAESEPGNPQTQAAMHPARRP